jgi:hypothetical protein
MGPMYFVIPSSRYCAAAKIQLLWAVALLSAALAPSSVWTPGKSLRVAW